MRADDRANNQLRAMEGACRPLTRPDGSAKFAQGKTIALAAVYGPIEVLHKDELLDRATVEVWFQPSQGVRGPAERLQEKFLRGILETVILTTLHPRTLITIIVQEIVNDGSLLAAAVNASMLAVLDAGLPVKSTAAAVQCSLTRLGGDFILDPSTQEEKEAIACGVFVWGNSIKHALACSVYGRCGDDDLFKMQEVSKEASYQIYQCFGELLQKM